MYKALLVLASYGIGMFPTARLVVGAAIAGGSGNPGASNAYRTAGKAKGALVLLGDGAKGALPTAATLALTGSRPLAFACGTAAVLGHVFPATNPTKGGKGVATAAGMATVLFPLPAAITALIWALAIKLTNTASVASLAAVAALPVTVALTGHPAWELVATTAVAVLICVRHASNLRRLARGEERTLT